MAYRIVFQVLAMRRASHGQEQPKVVTCLTCLSVELAAMGSYQDAIIMAMEALEIRRRLKRQGVDVPSPVGDWRDIDGDIDTPSAAGVAPHAHHDAASLAIMGNISNWLAQLGQLYPSSGMALEVRPCKVCKLPALV